MLQPGSGQRLAGVLAVEVRTRRRLHVAAAGRRRETRMDRAPPAQLLRGSRGYWHSADRAEPRTGGHPRHGGPARTTASPCCGRGAGQLLRPRAMLGWGLRHRSQRREVGSAAGPWASARRETNRGGKRLTQKKRSEPAFDS
jgi:hypothetical protein